MPVQQVARHEDYRCALSVVLVVDLDGGGVFLADFVVGHHAATGRSAGPELCIPVPCAAVQAGGIGNLTSLHLLGRQSGMPIVVRDGARGFADWPAAASSSAEGGSCPGCAGLWIRPPRKAGSWCCWVTRVWARPSC